MTALSSFLLVIGRRSNGNAGAKAGICNATAMSALCPKADMCGATSDVRYVPIADIRDYLGFEPACNDCQFVIASSVKILTFFQGQF